MPRDDGGPHPAGTPTALLLVAAALLGARAQGAAAGARARRPRDRPDRHPERRAAQRARRQAAGLRAAEGLPDRDADGARPPSPRTSRATPTGSANAWKIGRRAASATACWWWSPRTTARCASRSPRRSRARCPTRRGPHHRRGDEAALPPERLRRRPRCRGRPAHRPGQRRGAARGRRPRRRLRRGPRGGGGFDWQDLGIFLFVGGRSWVARSRAASSARSPGSLALGGLTGAAVMVLTSSLVIAVLAGAGRPALHAAVDRLRCRAQRSAGAAAAWRQPGRWIGRRRLAAGVAGFGGGGGGGGGLAAVSARRRWRFRGRRRLEDW